MKKFTAALAAAALMMTAVGCGSANTGDTADTTAAADNAAAEGKTYNIGIVQLVQHEALDAATQGFMDTLTEKLGDNVKFDLQNANGESTNCSTIATGFVASNVDLILANATAALQASGAATSNIPILGTSVTDYATALEIDDWTGVTGRNISGTSDLAPIDEQEKMLKELFPEVKQVGIIYCSAEANSKYQATLFGDALTADGIAFKEYSAADTNEISAVVSTAVSECDVLYIPTDNTMASSTETIKNIVVPAGIPVIAGEEGICSGCGVATLSISYYDLGCKTGEMAYEILVNGADPATMEIAFAPNVTKKYNAQICADLGITPPEGYVAIETE
ncbi:MAG: ABC transporter substrate-binding protein [Oscillospiraceae bacterium]|nr:ABC transporter substrate-binding protein [Oscillospiraceae bacterium]MDD7279275.1 ABC transporter substrate-binding protein [Oscillospiraceae bacterium]MDY2863377.1 ABC transporter substrate-binding protein [Oscillospiraceae bacterium]